VPRCLGLQSTTSLALHPASSYFTRCLPWSPPALSSLPMVRVPASSQFLLYCSRLRLCILISLQKSRNTYMHTGHSVLSRASTTVGARGTLPDLVRLSSFLVSSLVFPSIGLHFANLPSRSQLALYALKPETRVQAVVHKAASMLGSGEYHFVVGAAAVYL
jgi:hypothetical protein